MSVPEIAAAELLDRRRRGDSLTLLDVREDWELAVASVPDVLHMPMGQIADRIAEIDRDRDVVVLCRSGRRSFEVAKFLQQNGFMAVNLAGGILAWSGRVGYGPPGTSSSAPLPRTVRPGMRRTNASH